MVIYTLDASGPAEKTGASTPRGALHVHATLEENANIPPANWLKHGEHGYDGSQARQRVPYLLPKSTEEDHLVDTVVQPDVFIVSDLQKIDARGLRSAPDWLAEVLSPSTAAHDRFVKLPAYERAGVGEVWLIHPIDRTLTIYRLEAGYYGSPTILELKGKTQVTDFPGVSIDWDQALDGLP